MPKNIIPKDNIPKIAEVRYLEDKSQETKKIETPKVLEWLIWKDKQGKEFYRVFGSWKCDNKKKFCGGWWNSAYTWILLQKYKDSVPIKELDKNKDYYQQECKSCANKVNKLVNYEHLRLSDNKEEIKPHRSDLCAKCQTGATCQGLLRYQNQVRLLSFRNKFPSRFLSSFGRRL